MNTYRVERMKFDDYCRYMAGAYNYDVEVVEIQAETAEEAAAKAAAVGYTVNEGYIKTVEEIAVEDAAREAAYQARQAKAQARKEKRLATEMRKAQEAGMTVEEYRKAKARKAQATKLEKEIAELEKQLANKKALLKKVRN